MNEKITCFGFLVLTFTLLVGCGRDANSNTPEVETSPESESESEGWRTLATTVAPVLSPQQALSSFKLPAGYDIEAVAAEPLIGDPVAIAWDEDGRLYVVEMRSYMIDAEGSDERKAIGRVVVLTDEDGNGIYENSEVFLDNLILPRAIAVVNDGVLIAEPPNLVLCSKRSPLKCLEPKRLGSYATDYETTNVEHLENGLLQGLDNWLYSARSERRLRVVDGRLIEQPTEARGQWGITQDDQGRLYYNTNSNLVLGDWFPAEPLRFDYLDTSDNTGVLETISENDEVWSSRVNPGINRVTGVEALRADGRLYRPTSASGVVVNRGTALGKSMAGHFFVPEPAANLVAQLAPVAMGDFEMSAEHVVYKDEKWGSRDFLTSTDERFRPVDVKVGPDGALYIIDMYRGIIQHADFLSDELRAQVEQRQLAAPIGLGRIWRIKKTDSEIPKFEKLSTMTDTELVAQLSNENGWRRDTAQRLLLERKTATGLSELITSQDPLVARHAVWLMHGRGQSLKPYFGAAANSVRIHILRAQGERFSAQHLLTLLKNERDVVLKRELVLTLRHHASQQHVQFFLADFVAENIEHTVLMEAAVAASRGHELPVLERLLSAPPVLHENALSVLSQLAQRAYLSLRGDITEQGASNTNLTPLLALTENVNSGAHAQLERIQIALLNGLGRSVGLPGFKPAQVATAPKLFVPKDGASVELAKARLAAHRAFTWPGDTLVAGAEPLTEGQKRLKDIGEQFYARCASCHGSRGQGIAGLAPTLASTDWVTGPPEWLARIVLQGLTGPIDVAGKTWNGNMPAHGSLPDLDNKTLAGLVIYLRRSWGNTASAVTEAQVADIRNATINRRKPWTVQELKKVPYDRGYGRYTGKYKIAFVTMTVYEEDDTLKMKVPLYGGGVLEPTEIEHVFSANDDKQVVSIRFVQLPSAGISELILTRSGSDVVFKKME